MNHYCSNSFHCPPFSASFYLAVNESHVRGLSGQLGGGQGDDGTCSAEVVPPPDRNHFAFYCNEDGHIAGYDWPDIRARSYIPELDAAVSTSHPGPPFASPAVSTSVNFVRRPMSPTRLYDLPERALQNMLCKLSSKPAKGDRFAYVEPDDALMAVDPASALYDVARASFPNLSTTAYPENDEGYVVYLRNESDPSCLTRWLRSAGESLTALTLGNRICAADSDTLEEMLQVLEKNCVAVRRLDIDGCFMYHSIHEKSDLSKIILEKTRGRLHELVAREFDAPAIEQHCSGLKVLHLQGRCDRFLDVLRVVGPTFESIQYRGRLISIDFEQIQKLCLKLSSIDLMAECEHRAAYTDLLCSYGAQLRFTVFGWNFMPDCERILSSCPNLRCSLMLETHYDEFVDLSGEEIDSIVWHRAQRACVCCSIERSINAAWRTWRSR